MSKAPTKIFGMNVTIDPKIIVLALLVLAFLIYHFTSGSNEVPSNPPASASIPAIRPIVNPKLAARTSAAARRAGAVHNDHASLKLVSVDGSRGDVDPTLRLNVLERVKNVPPAAGLRNLFDAGGVVANLPPLPKNAPKITPGPITPPPPAVVTENKPPPPPPFVIPLKYYGFVKPSGGHTLESNRGLFMDGDNILVGGEGDVLEKRFLIVALTPNMARLEDTRAKQGQDLQVTPEAPPAP